jgi:hypothetical protein
MEQMRRQLVKKIAVKEGNAPRLLGVFARLLPPWPGSRRRRDCQAEERHAGSVGLPSYPVDLACKMT